MGSHAPTRPSFLQPAPCKSNYFFFFKFATTPMQKALFFPATIPMQKARWLFLSLFVFLQPPHAKSTFYSRPPADTPGLDSPAPGGAGLLLPAVFSSGSGSFLSCLLSECLQPQGSLCPALPCLLQARCHQRFALSWGKLFPCLPRGQRGEERSWGCTQGTMNEAKMGFPSFGDPDSQPWIHQGPPPTRARPQEPPTQTRGAAASTFRHPPPAAAPKPQLFAGRKLITGPSGGYLQRSW